MDEEIGFNEYRICSTDSWVLEEKLAMIIPSLISSYTAQLLEAEVVIKIEENVHDGVEEEEIEARMSPLGSPFVLEGKQPLDIDLAIKPTDGKPPVSIGDTCSERTPFFIAELENEPPVLIQDVYRKPPGLMDYVEDELDFVIGGMENESPNLIAEVDKESSTLIGDKIAKNNNSTQSFGRGDVINVEDDFVDREISENVELVDLTNKNEIKCDVCSKLLKTQGGLKAHMKRHNKCNIISSDSSDDGDMANRNCNIISSDSSDSNTSSSDQSNPVPLEDRNSRKSFKCYVCSKTLFSKSSLKLHIGMHCKCNVCKKLFSNHDELKLHKLNMHASDTSYECEVCHEIFAKKNLTAHMKMHVGISHVGKECEQCLKVFASKHALKVHKLRMHADCKTYMCGVCDKAFAHKDHLMVHITMHTGAELHVCKECSTPFYSKEQLAEHKQSQHPKIAIFTCGVCKEKFADASTLIEHLKIHSKPSSEKTSHKCQLCNDSFNTSAALSHHITRLHKHICKVCGMSFNTSGGLESHTIVHTGINPYQCKERDNSSDTNAPVVSYATMYKWVNPYKCGICEKTFSTSDALSIHVAIHGGNPLQI